MDADSGEQKNKNFDRVRVSPRRAHCETKESMMTVLSLVIQLPASPCEAM
jgi:hypothetical protein